MDLHGATLIGVHYSKDVLLFIQVRIVLLFTASTSPFSPHGERGEPRSVKYNFLRFLSAKAYGG